MKFDLTAFARDAKLIAQSVGAEAVFSFLNRTLAVPHGCAAMAWEPSGPARVVPGGMSLEGDGVAKLLFVRTPAFSLEYAFAKLASQDGYEVSARVSCGVQVVAERAELAAFCERVLGSASSVTVERLQQFCQEVVHTAVDDFIKTRLVSDLLTPKAWTDFDAVLAEHFKPLGFSSGLALGDSARITIDSADYARAADARKMQQLREGRVAEERRLREVAAAARQHHISELGTTLEKLRDMSAKHEGAALPDLIRALDPSQRGGLYHALLAERKGHRPSVSILIVAGDELIWIDPASPERPSRRVALSSDIGPLRSVRAARWEGRPVILVGAKSGVHLLQTEQDPRLTYAFDAGRSLRGGVNSAAIIGEELFATHSEVGLIRWSLRRPESFELLCAETLAGAKSVRDAHADDAGRLWLSADRRVVCVTPVLPVRQEDRSNVVASAALPTGPDGATSAPALSATILDAPSAVTTLTVADGRVFAGMDNGQIVGWQDRTAHRDTIRPATGQAVESIVCLEGGGVPRLLVADRRPYLDMMVLGDSSSIKYAAGQPIRWALAAGDWIAGVNDRRDQLVLWRMEDPAEPAAVISIGQLCGNSVQDIATTEADQ